MMADLLLVMDVFGYLVQFVNASLETVASHGRRFLLNRDGNQLPGYCHPGIDHLGPPPTHSVKPPYFFVGETWIGKGKVGKVYSVMCQNVGEQEI